MNAKIHRIVRQPRGRTIAASASAIAYQGLTWDGRPAEESVRAITEVLTSARTHTSLPPS